MLKMGATVPEIEHALAARGLAPAAASCVVDALLEEKIYGTSQDQARENRSRLRRGILCCLVSLVCFVAMIDVVLFFGDELDQVRTALGLSPRVWRGVAAPPLAVALGFGAYGVKQLMGNRDERSVWDCIRDCFGR